MSRGKDSEVSHAQSVHASFAVAVRLMLQLPWFRGRRSSSEQAEIQRLSNQAILVWVGPARADETLAAFLATIDPPLRRDVEREARSVFRSFMQMLPRSRDGIATGDAATVVEQRMRAKFPWLSPEAYARLDSYAQWLTWHG
ncbi:hypothetical protein HJG53_01535 [Sphingomonas sp. ID1715]|uniref:hypothetical protein n=1 Tax=Sphingomonas sp. ID1715 TaxID=1656898 RepID=UPI001487C3CE|nr:hypothetical protein [Sphingomonas sp. ID1715]NNM75589.1 hypothetical protein [Sphingomonas sp. ID1715]